MGDLTGEYFARIAFIRAVEWLSKYQKIDGLVVRNVLEDQKKITIKLKRKFNNIRFGKESKI